ncbi:hypothetical protein [Rhizobium rhizogenes]|uniref:hypothetical protein n=1 Tax=Rhizobium rhizogenes TaxID=359 RepID=UPI0022B6EFD8|nr:hypothetical protein [Rhizobium rhizogenes]MCZ7448153.1 hypothetical protein [Rhizobium rhizogenes]MCZ7465814.1 hypothetical protein [Rhizobium rhizogenes]
MKKIERRLPALSRTRAQPSPKLDHDGIFRTAIGGIYTTSTAAPRRREAILPDHLFATLETRQGNPV